MSPDFELGSGDVLMVVPPFASLTRPSLAAHILQSCARSKGFEVKIFYSNFILAAEIGEKLYEKICLNLFQEFIGEKLFASVAYNLSQRSDEYITNTIKKLFLDNILQNLFQSSYLGMLSELSLSDLAFMKDFHNIAVKWANTVNNYIVKENFMVIGSTTSFEQTAPSILLLNKIKHESPDIITIIGGANCESEMAEGILSLNSSVDYILSGQSETSFPNFLKQIKEKKYPLNRIIYGKPCTNLESIPTPDYSEYYDQLKFWFPNSLVVNDKTVSLPYECSRGCWWGEKHQCKFCGVNGETIKFRYKSSLHVIQELKELLEKHPNKNVMMADAIMPHEYFKTLLPQLSEKMPGLNIFCEQKSNLSLKNIVDLKKAGIIFIQPGIESLSTACLKLMDKGVSAKQNINLLRFARSVDLDVGWNLLYGFPGDKIKEYENMIDIIPLLSHLQPPICLTKVIIQRFSQYFMYPDKYGIKNIRPFNSYFEFLPSYADIHKIAYNFMADYKSESLENPDVIEKLKGLVKTWRDYWVSSPFIPKLSISDLGNDNYLLHDSRNLPGTQALQIINYNQALIALVGKETESSELNWALRNKLIVELDSQYVPLATAEPDLINKFTKIHLNLET